MLKRTAKTRQDPLANVLKLKAARMQGIPVAGALIVQRIAPSSLASTAVMADAASLAPSESVSHQRGIKQQNSGPWKLNWYECSHSRAIISLSIAIFRQTMLQNHPFDNKDLDAHSFASYRSAADSLKDSVEKG